MISKAPMKHAKYGHATESISLDKFISIGGYTGRVVMADCEEYDVNANIWKSFPPLNKARSYIGTALLKDRYLYAIGGYRNNNNIEMIDLNLRNNWEIVKLNMNQLEFCDSPAAFPISDNEILILCGSADTDVGIFSTKSRVVEKLHLKSLKESYYYNSVCIIDECAYIIGSFSGGIHIFNLKKMRFNDIKFKAAIYSQFH